MRLYLSYLFSFFPSLYTTLTARAACAWVRTVAEDGRARHSGVRRTAVERIDAACSCQVRSPLAFLAIYASNVLNAWFQITSHALNSIPAGGSGFPGGKVAGAATGTLLGLNRLSRYEGVCTACRAVCSVSVA